MEDIKEPVKYCLNEVNFGMMTDTPNINFVPVIDIDRKSVFNIPYTLPNITIHQLLEEYKNNTKCMKYYKNHPFLRIVQGSRLDQLAYPEQTLDSLSLNLNEICFHLVDCSLKEAEQLFKKGYNGRQNIMRQFVVKVSFQGQKYDLKVNSQLTVIALKKMIAQNIPKLKNITPDKMQIMHKGFFLTNDTSDLERNNINMYSTLSVKIKNKTEETSYFIKVKFPTGDTFDFNIMPFNYIRNLKEKIQETYFINVHNQKFVYAGHELRNHLTFSDNNIPSGARIILIFKGNEYFNRIRQGTLIMTSDGKQVPVQNLKEGNKIAIIDPITGNLNLSGETIYSIDDFKIKQYMTFTMDTSGQKDKLITCSDCYFECQNGQIIHSNDLQYYFTQSEQRPNLRKAHKQLGIVKDITHELLRSKQQRQLQPSRLYYKIHTITSCNFIAHRFRMYNNVLSVVIKYQNKRVYCFIIAVSPSEKISTIKHKIIKLQKSYSQLECYDFDKLSFYFEDSKLQEQLTLADYTIENYHSIVAVIKSPAKISTSKSKIITSSSIKIILEQKMIQIQISPTQKRIIKYIDYKNKTVEEIIKQITTNSSSSYFFIYSNIILFPTDLLVKIQQQSMDFMTESDSTILMNKCEKVAFLQKMNIKKQQIKNHSTIYNSNQSKQYISSKSTISFQKTNHEFFNSKQVKIASKRIQQDKTIKEEYFKSDYFFNAFLFLTSRKYNNHIYNYIKNFQKYKDKYEQTQSYFTIIKDIYINMQLLPSFYGTCYLGLNNFKFSRYFKQHNTFYLHSFTMAYLEKDSVMKEVKQCSGPSTFFHIRSLNGKQICQFSLYPDAKQILFGPFTPFLIEKIDNKAGYDEVYLVELSSPISFKKDIVLWVDDEPTNNVEQIKAIYKQVDDIEILQATSTIEAEKWIQQFGWLLKWKGLDFKLVSDMRRFEGIQGNKIQNKTAGIDLLVQLYSKHGVTARTLIFCFKEDEAKELAKKANLEKDKYYEITKKRTVLYNFIKKKKHEF